MKIHLTNQHPDWVICFLPGNCRELTPELPVSPACPLAAGRRAGVCAGQCGRESQPSWGPHRSAWGGPHGGGALGGWGGRRWGEGTNHPRQGPLAELGLGSWQELLQSPLTPARSCPCVPGGVAIRDHPRDWALLSPWRWVPCPAGCLHRVSTPRASSVSELQHSCL